MLSRIDAKAFGHWLGDAGHADEVFLNDLAGAGAIRNRALREAERVESCNRVLLLVEADRAQGREDARKAHVALAQMADVRRQRTVPFAYSGAGLML